METLYKYFNWEDVASRRILTEGEVYFCNATKWKNFGEFNFKFEEVDPKALYNEIELYLKVMFFSEPAIYEKWFNFHLSRYKIDFRKYNTLSNVERDILEVDARDKIINHRVDSLINKPELYERSTRQFYFNRTGIFSTSLSKESSQLWNWKQNFCKNNNGQAICIGLDFLKLKQKLDEVGNYSIGTINYLDKVNTVPLFGNSDDFVLKRLNAVTFTLPEDMVKDIAEQMEVRVVKFLPIDNSVKSPDRFLKLDSDCIKEIIVHADASHDFIVEVEKIAKKIGCSSFSIHKP